MKRPPPLPIFTLKGTMAAVNCLNHLNPNLLCAGTTEGKVHLWDLETKREKYTFQASKESCLNICHVDGQLVTQEKGGSIHLWSLKGSDFFENGSIKSSYVGFCKFDSISTLQDILIFAPSDDSCINIICLKSQKTVSSLISTNENIGEIMVLKCFEMEGSQYLLSAYESGDIFLWDLRSRKCLNKLKVDGTPMDLDFDPYKRMGVCGTESNEFCIFELDKSTNLLCQQKTKAITNPGVSRVLIRPDRKLLVLGCWDGRIRLFSWKTLKPLAVLAEHVDTIHDVYFLRDQSPSARSPIVMAVAGKDKLISLWDVYNE